MGELKKKKKVILCGDLNCAHKEIDIARPKSNIKSAGFTIEERISFKVENRFWEIVGQWVCRHFQTKEPHFAKVQSVDLQV